MNNNKSTIIGWVLIFAVMVGFFWMNKPSEEQLAEQTRLKAVQDSIALVEAQKVLDQAVAEANYNHTFSQDSTNSCSSPFAARKRADVLSCDKVWL